MIAPPANARIWIAAGVTDLRRGFGGWAYWQYPTLLWLDSSDASLHALCWGGVVVGGLLVLGVWPRACLVLLYLGVMQLGVSYWLFARGSRRVPAAEASLISMLEPVCNPLWVVLGTGERPGPWSIAGGAIVLGAVALRTFAKQ